MDISQANIVVLLFFLVADIVACIHVTMSAVENCVLLIKLEHYDQVIHISSSNYLPKICNKFVLHDLRLFVQIKQKYTYMYIHSCTLT